MSSGKDLALTHVSVLVGNQREALEFYRDAIGLEVRQDMPFGKARWLTLGPASQPTIEFLLEVPEMVPNDGVQQGARTRIATGAQGTLIFGTDDVDATFERLEGAGVEVAQRPITQPYGVRDCGFRDPWGNHLRFSQQMP
ncbi:VOC family protein [Nocardia sp. NPDC003693]